MKTTQINLPALILSFAIVGLVADMMPVPGLRAGVIAQSANWVTATIQAPASAAIAPR
uniref:Uncharacterized protein n=1 Tax=Cyanothece sp. (strain PCC 7425 / ATCC 29141) TaxID=395961 RepID=B8HS47_CYAP4